MPLSQRRSLFGVHSFSPYRVTDGTFYGTMKVVKSSSLNISGSLVKLTGGSNPYPWDIQEGPGSADMTLKAGEYPDWVFELFGGLQVTNNTADPLGHCSTAVNKQGTSAVSSVGLASVTVLAGSESDIKGGRFVFKAVSPTTFNVYLSTDADMGRGTDSRYVDDTLLINPSPLTLTAAGVANLVGYGIKFTGGAGPIAMVAGDTAIFDCRPKNTGSMVGIFGGVGQSYPEFGAFVMGKKKDSGELFEFQAYRCKGSGLPLQFDENKFSEFSGKVELFYDSVEDGIGRMRFITPTTPN